MPTSVRTAYRQRLDAGQLKPDAAQEAALRATLTEWQAALEAQAGAFLTEAEVPEVLNHLYRYADESGVEIARVTAAGAAQPEFASAAGLQDALAGSTEPTYRPECADIGAIDQLLHTPGLKADPRVVFTDEITLPDGARAHLSDHYAIEAALHLPT